MNLRQKENIMITSSASIAERLLSSRTKPSKPFRRGLPNVTVLRFPIISWSSTVDARNVRGRKERAGERDKEWNLAEELNQHRPVPTEKK
jgi:hypothetical protein